MAESGYARFTRVVHLPSLAHLGLLLTAAHWRLGLPLFIGWLATWTVLPLLVYLGPARSRGTRLVTAVVVMVLEVGWMWAGSVAAKGS